MAHLVLCNIFDSGISLMGHADFIFLLQVHVMVHDNAANAISASEEADLPYFTCLAHTINLIVQDCEQSQRFVRDAVAVSRNLVGHFSHSSKDTAELRRIQKELAPDCAAKVLLQDVRTRWNSTLIMIRRLIELRDPLTLFHGRGGSVTLPKPHQWSLLESTARLLVPFEVATKDISRSTSCASLHIPAAEMLRQELEGMADDGTGSLREHLIKQVMERFESVEEDMLLAVATFLDPRWKHHAFKKPLTTDSVERRLSDDLAATKDDCVELPPPAKRPRQDAPTTTPQQQLSSMWRKVVAPASTVSRPDSLASEVLQYKGAEQPEDDDILKWWRDESRFPLLSKAARRYLSAPATSVDSERIFSASGNIFSDKRTRLSAKNLETLVFLNVNLNILDGE